jgi:hypothetical protein
VLKEISLQTNKQTNETNMPTITNPRSDPHQDREALLSVASQSCCCQADRQAEVNLIDLECHKNQHHDHHQMQNCASINQSLLLLLPKQKYLHQISNHKLCNKIS